MHESTDLSPRYYEDLEPGLMFKTQGITLTEDAIIRFALEWDFQPIHADRVASAKSMFGGLTASGLQTFLVTLRLCNSLWSGTSVGLGMDELRFVGPVRPGMTLTVHVRIAGHRRSKTREGFGIVQWDIQARNENGETVLSVKMANLMRLRASLTNTEAELKII